MGSAGAAAIALVVLVIAAIVFLVVGGLAGLAAAAAFLAAAAAAAEGILAVLAVVGIIVLAVIVAVRLYQAWTRDDLSDYDRGRLVGRSILDIASVFLPGRILARLRGWVRLRQLAAAVGGEARLAQLLTWAGGDLAAVERLAGEVRSIEELEVLLSKTSSLEELTELRALVPDLPMLLRLLSKVDNAGELRAVLAEVGGNAALLDRLLAEVGTVTELRRLLGVRGMTAEMLARLLQRTGSAAELDGLLGQVGNDAALLDRLLGRANLADVRPLLLRLSGNPGLLADLLDSTDSVPQLDRMLSALNDDGAKLGELLQLAGGRPGARALEELMALASSEGKSATSVEALVREAGGNPTELERLLGIARRFTNRVRVGGGPTGNHPPYGAADTPHFLDGHTYTFYDFARTTDPKSFWPVGTDISRIEGDLQAAVDYLNSPGGTVTNDVGITMPTPVRVMPQRTPNAALGPGTIRGPVRLTINGIDYQFGVRSRGVPPHQIGQFFPRGGAGVESLAARLLRAIQQMMG